MRVKSSSYDLLVQVYNSFTDNSWYSINEVAKKNLVSWRSARNCLNTLYLLGLIIVPSGLVKRKRYAKKV